MKNWLIWTAVLFTLLSWWLLLPTVNSLNIPISKTHGIISKVVIQGRSPLTDVAMYLMLLLSPSLAILFWDFLNTKKRFLNSKKRRIASVSVVLKQLILKIVGSKKMLPISLLLIVTCWILNVTQPILSPHLPQDSFHYGEKVGLSETFLQNPEAFFDKAYVLIHGFGLNVMPGVIGFWAGGYEKDIAYSILVFYIQSITPIFFSFLILLEISAYISAVSKWKIFIILCLLYFPCHGVVFGLIDRDAVFLIQAFLAIRWVRLLTEMAKQNDANSVNKELAIYPILLGFLIPISILYVYDRSLYSIAIFVSLIFFIYLTQNIRFFWRSSFLALISIVFTSGFLSLVFGWNYITVSIGQIRYWSKVAGLFTSLPYPQINISLVAPINWLPIFLQTLTFTILCIDFRIKQYSYSQKIKAFFLEHSITIFMLLCAVFYMRIALGRSDIGHLISPGFFAVFAFVSLIGHYLTKKDLAITSWKNTLIITLLFACLFNLSFLTTATDIFMLARYPQVVNYLIKQNSTALINPSYQEAANQLLSNEMKEQSCFYTLTSEGMWYRIFSLKPCSKYWYLIYSTTKESQQELIEELKESKPKIILYSNQSLGNGIDGVKKEVSHLLVHQYIWQNYLPYKYLGGNWFWIRREKEMEISELLMTLTGSVAVTGHFDVLSTLDTNQGLDIVASGWTLLPENQKPHENAILLTYNLVSSPDKLIPLALGSASDYRYDVATALNKVEALQTGWNISFNKLNIPADTVKIRAWAYNSIDQKFHEIPSAIPDKFLEGVKPTFSENFS